MGNKNSIRRLEWIIQSWELQVVQCWQEEEDCNFHTSLSLFLRTAHNFPFRSTCTDYPSSFHMVYRKNILIINGFSYGKNKTWLN